MAEKNNFDISVVIPALNAEEYLPALLKSIEAQTLLPKEIVIIDSSRTDRTAEIVETWKGIVPVNYHKVDFAYPGHARNIGVTLARYNWIAFIDCRTIPDTDWLERCSATALRNEADFVSGIFVSAADSHFKHIVLAATFGNVGVRSLPGSLILKRVFEDTGGFLTYTRAGEDIEWRNRLATGGVRMAYLETPVLRYEGLPSSLGSAICKWYEYAISNARINVQTQQKLIYGAIFMLLLLIFVYKWNYIFARWNEDSVFYIPNITKIFLASVFVFYSVYRSVVRPLNKKVKLSFLFPLRWLQVLFVGLCLDIAKAPGLLLGACVLARKYWRQLKLF